MLQFINIKVRRQRVPLSFIFRSQCRPWNFLYRPDCYLCADEYWRWCLEALSFPRLVPVPVRVQTVGTLCARQPRHTVRDVCSLRRLIKAVAKCTTAKTLLPSWWRRIPSYYRLIRKTGKEEECGPPVHHKLMIFRDRPSGGINPQSQIRFCSGPETITDGRRAQTFNWWIYHHSCLST